MVVPCLSWGPREWLGLHQKQGSINPGPRACDRKVVSSLVAALSHPVILSAAAPVSSPWSSSPTRRRCGWRMVTRLRTNRSHCSCNGFPLSLSLSTLPDFHEKSSSRDGSTFTLHSTMAGHQHTAKALLLCSLYWMLRHTAA